MARLTSSEVPYESPLVRLSDVGCLFLQDHRENGQLQPDHPGDCPSLRAAGGNKSLHYQPAEPLQLHQHRRQPAGEERPAAADAATRHTRGADHYHPLHKLVCMSQTLCWTSALARVSNKFAVAAVVRSRTVELGTSGLILSFFILFKSSRGHVVLGFFVS